MTARNEAKQIIDTLDEAQAQKALEVLRELQSVEPEPESVETAPAKPKRKPGRPATGRNPYETTKTVRNKIGKKYVYRVLVTPLANGKRKEKILGRVK